jgi:hypothetical protein
LQLPANAIDTVAIWSCSGCQVRVTSGVSEISGDEVFLAAAVFDLTQGLRPDMAQPQSTGPTGFIPPSGY